MHCSHVVGLLAVTLLHATSIAAQVPTTPRVNPRALKPDLEITIEPRTTAAAPVRFVVRNGGLAAVATPTLLRVRVSLLPLTSENLAEYERVMGQSLREDRRFAEACKSSGDFEAAVRPLRPGESETVTRPAPTIQSTSVVTAPLTPSPDGSPGVAGSSLRALQMKFRCVYELRVEVDANRQVAESDESNNVLTQRYIRDAEVDVLRYYR